MLTAETVAGQRYRLRDVIGRGGGADVFRADDLETGREVAVKVLRAASPEDLRRFELEAQTLARLDHPAIVRMCDRGEEDGTPYLVLDLIDGEPLSARLERGPLTEDEVIRIGTVLADALSHAHAIGVVHRDVKPGNVLIDGDGRVHLTDFGIARLTDVTAVTATGLVIGTPAYLAPEQVAGEGATPATDVYALGLVLIEALAGERVYPGPPSEAALARLHRRPDVPATANRSLASLLASMTASEPHLRPTSASVAEALTVAADNPPSADSTMVLPVMSDETTTIPAATVTAVSAGPVVLRRKRSRAPILVAVVLALAFLIGFVTSRDGGSGPASADTPTTSTTPATVVATTTPTTAAPTTSPQTTPPKKRGKKGD